MYTDETQTDLYLVRIWRGKSRDGAPSLHGKLQHAVSGESLYFEGLSSLPEALAEMLEQEAGSVGADTHSDSRDRSGSDSEPEKS